MSLPIENKLKPSNFWELYKKEITPWLQEIDLFIKSFENNAAIAEAAQTLSISEDEILYIMNELNIQEVNKMSFFEIMKNGSSKICQLFKRECDLQCPFVYKREDIAYIYELEIDVVNMACDALGIKEATAYTLPLLFSQIPVA